MPCLIGLLLIVFTVTNLCVSEPEIYRSMAVDPPFDPSSPIKNGDDKGHSAQMLSSLGEILVPLSGQHGESRALLTAAGERLLQDGMDLSKSAREKSDDDQEGDDDATGADGDRSLESESNSSESESVESEEEKEESGEGDERGFVSGQPGSAIPTNIMPQVGPLPEPTVVMQAAPIVLIPPTVGQIPDPGAIFPYSQNDSTEQSPVSSIADFGNNQPAYRHEHFRMDQQQKNEFGLEPKEVVVTDHPYDQTLKLQNSKATNQDPPPQSTNVSHQFDWTLAVQRSSLPHPRPSRSLQRKRFPNGMESYGTPTMKRYGTRRTSAIPPVYPYRRKKTNVTPESEFDLFVPRRITVNRELKTKETRKINYKIKVQSPRIN